MAPRASSIGSNYFSDLERSSSLKERAGVKGGLAWSFAAGWLLPGMAAWPYGWLSLIGAGFVRAGWRVRDRAEPGRAAALAVSDRFRQRPRDDVAEPAPEGVVALLARECLTPGVQRQREDRPRRRAVLDHVLNLPGKAVPSPAMAAWLGLTYRCRVVSRLWPLMAMSRER